MLMGHCRPDAVKTWRYGQEVEFSRPVEAPPSGIAIIEKELSPVWKMTVAETISLGCEPPPPGVKNWP